MMHFIKTETGMKPIEPPKKPKETDSYTGATDLYEPDNRPNFLSRLIKRIFRL